MQKELIVSAGIDIGTSTTKMVVSELEVANTAGYGVVPRIEITNKRILHRSAIFRTPLLSKDVINMGAIHQLILAEYRAAGLSPSQIQTGAILITGETATKSNASEVIHTLSNEVGDFLVATAGPDLEGILAAKGSGAFEYSAAHPSCTIANIDIGGGTTNIAVYQNKRLLGTCTLHIGGRLIEFQEERIQTITQPIQRWSNVTGTKISPGIRRTSGAVHYLITDMIDGIVQAIRGELAHDHSLLLGHQPNWEDATIDTLMFSGGVSIFLDEQQSDLREDIGWLLAQEIKQSDLYNFFHIVQPTETVAATVIGTSTQTTEISGATIQALAEDLPLKNSPLIVMDASYTLVNIDSKIQQVIEQAAELYNLKTEPIPVAWFIKGLPRLSFHDLEHVATSFLTHLQKFLPEGVPYLFVLQQDYGRVFGQTLLRLQPNRTVIAIDQITIDQGDYIDIGRPLTAGVVPVVVKTLAFQGRQSDEG